ncbi:hypothetical protein [Tateyamaria sp.]|uniref:hypothetical protein n=1 Tax=Tateyamaria sp. TaxID=1929288 RepID=UPI00329CA4B2
MISLPGLGRRLLVNGLKAEKNYSALPFSNSEYKSALNAVFEHLTTMTMDKVRTHPLGFVRLTLAERHVPDDMCIVLNFWNSDATHIQKEDIHDHCYDFASVCLEGSIGHEFYAERPNSNSDKFHQLQFKSGCCDTEVLRSSVLKKLVVVATDQVDVGGAYFMSGKKLHAVTDWRPGSITLQFQSGLKQQRASVFRHSDQKKNIHTKFEFNQVALDHLRERIGAL